MYLYEFYKIKNWLLQSSIVCDSCNLKFEFVFSFIIRISNVVKSQF